LVAFETIRTDTDLDMFETAGNEVYCRR